MPRLNGSRPTSSQSSGPVTHFLNEHWFNDWIPLLNKLVWSIGAWPPQTGVEIFPPDSVCRGVGKALPAPGSWNPATDRCSEVLFHTVSPILHHPAPSPRTPAGKEEREEAIKPSCCADTPLQAG